MRRTARSSARSSPLVARRGRRPGSSCTARTRRRAARASGRSSPSRGSRCGRRRPRRRTGCRGAGRRAPACAARRSTARRCRRCGRGRCRRGGGTRRELVAEGVDGHLHERGAAARRRPCPCVGEPGEVAAGLEARRLPELRVQRRQLLDDVAAARRDVVVLRVREPARRSRRDLRAPSRSGRRRCRRTRRSGTRTGISGARSR